jgi:hypothetical protein
MEKRRGETQCLGQTRIEGIWRQFSVCDTRPKNFGWAAAILFSFLGAQAAPIQLLSVGSTSPINAQGTSADAKYRSPLNESFGRLPLSFETTDAEGSRFLCRGLDSHVWLSPVEAVLEIEPARKGHRKLPAVDAPTSPGTADAPAGPPLRIQWLGANPNARAVPAEELPTKANYFIGNNAAQWRTQVPTYAKVRYQMVYPGIDLVYYGNQRQLEYDFVVAPGADPEPIAWRYEGAARIQIEEGGDLIVHTVGGKLRHHRPVAYQNMNGERKPISVGYVVRESDGRTVGFRVGPYDRTRPLIIDPVLVYSALLGGTGLDKGWDIAVDPDGSVYLTGETASANFPTNNALYPSNSSDRINQRDVFVAKLDAEGTNLVYSTYLGGGGDDAGFGIALDSVGDVYVTGVTASPNFPFPATATNSISTNLHGAAGLGIYPYDAFVVKLDPAGSQLLYSTFIGGTQPDSAMGIAVDEAGRIYVVGATASADFPTNGTTRPFAGGPHDAFVLKLTTGSTNLIYSTYLGGTGDDYGFGVAVDSAGSAVVVGLTTSADFPWTTNALQTNFAGGPYDVFITKLSPDGATQLYSTYLGGTADDEAHRVVLDNLGNICLAGFTTSLDFPTNNALYSANHGFADAFVVKLDPSGANLIYSTYLGGAFNDEVWGIAVDTNRNVYVIGGTSSPDFPTVNAYQSFLRGSENVFVTRLNANGTALDYSTYLGGFSIDEGYAIAVDHAGNAYITGRTSSANFPVYPPTNVAPTNFFAEDVFVAKLFPRNAELRAELSGPGAVTIRWPYGLPNFELQSTSELGTTNIYWATVTNTAPTVVGDDYSLSFTNVSGDQFFRLRRSQ